MRGYVGDINEAIEKGQPVHVAYSSADATESTGGGEKPPDAAKRRAEYGANEENRVTAHKSFIPEEVDRHKDGKRVGLAGTSLDNWMSNGEKLVQLAKDQKLRRRTIRLRWRRDGA